MEPGLTLLVSSQPDHDEVVVDIYRDSVYIGLLS